MPSTVYICFSDQSCVESVADKEDKDTIHRICITKQHTINEVHFHWTCLGYKRKSQRLPDLPT